MTLKERFADKLVQSDTHFKNDQLVAVLDICDELGLPDMYEALKNLVYRIDGGLALGEKLDVLPAREALTKAEGK